MGGERLDLDAFADRKGAFKLSIKRDPAKAAAYKKKAQKYFTLRLT